MAKAYPVMWMIAGILGQRTSRLGLWLRIEGIVLRLGARYKTRTKARVKARARTRPQRCTLNVLARS